jgi:hypothetical protein
MSTGRPVVNPWLIALTVTLATFMELLDTSIANVALPYIGGGLGRSYDEVTWILTTYLVANAVVLPISDEVRRNGNRRQNTNRLQCADDCDNHVQHGKGSYGTNKRTGSC